MLNVWGVTVLRSAVTRSRVFCHFLWTRRKQLFLAGPHRALGRLTGECYRQKQRKFTSLTRLELVKPLSSPSRFLQISTSIITDSPPSSLRASREIHDHHRVANWRHFVVQCRSIDELYEVNGLRHHGARRVRLSTSSLKQLGVNPTYTNPKRFNNNGLNQNRYISCKCEPSYRRTSRRV